MPGNGTSLTIRSFLSPTEWSVFTDPEQPGPVQCGPEPGASGGGHAKLEHDISSLQAGGPRHQRTITICGLPR